MKQRYKVVRKQGPYGAWYEYIPIVAAYNWLTADDELPTTPPAQPMGIQQPSSNVPMYDPTAIKLPDGPTDPAGSKWPSWVLPVGITVGVLVLLGGSTYVAVKIDKKRKAPKNEVIVKHNPRRRRRSKR